MSSESEAATGAEETRSPEQIEAEIEATRSELGDTVAAVAEKADVKAQAKAKVEEIKGQAKEKVGEIKDKAGEAAPDSAGAGAQQAQSLAREHPLPIGLAAAFIAGVVIGRVSRR